ncbi:hypothetical protein [Streptomyces ochraceiscleroticus]|uniref:Integral membrane protein n=1 Tax=Streptomyces ochraceiscleroticus TaxID=47761 RepID=A0ABW1MX51_9ACTN|nr:hypothetical protein [Streptomyces ochraceiscleroticus]
MHGPAAPAPPPPPRPAKPGTVVLLRVVFVAIAVLSIGMLAWVTLLRAALVHRRPVGWWIFGVDAALAIPLMAVVGSVPESDWRGDVALALILLQMAGAVAYYLVVDIRARARALARYPAGYGRTAQPYGAAAFGVPAYGAPGAPAGYAGGAVYEQGTMPGAPPGPGPGSGPGPYDSLPNPYAAPAPTPAGPQSPHAQPALAQPPLAQPRPQRIERVRAELDELSEYLRRGEGAGGEGRREEEGR